MQVLYKDRLVGVYRLCRTNNSLSCDYIYYEREYTEVVYASVLEHLSQLKVVNFDTEDEGLATFVNKYLMFPRFRTEQISLSVSPDVNVPERIIR